MTVLQSARDLVMRRRWIFLLVLLTAAGIAGAVTLAARGQERFPHDQHARLFPLCEGCHAGIETGAAELAYPSPQMCMNCHDGTTEPRVEWTGPTAHADNLDFTHPQHVAAVTATGDEALACIACHTPEGADRMSIVRTDPPVCLSCHGHAATDHYTDADCAVCHVAFANGDLPPSRIATLPVPPDHARPGFIADGHGQDAAANVTRCSVCHTRERCEACHLNAGDVAVIAQVPRAPQSWPLPQFASQYPVPPSHLTKEWIEDHGAGATRASCAGCHAQESCTTCHVEPVPAVIETLPRRGGMPVQGFAAVQDTGRRVFAPGAMTQREMPASHASRFFDKRHAAFAASQPQSCNACHTKTFCTDCHEAPAGPTFHPVNFTAQHASAGWGRRLECATCHETRTFCRACHIQNGLESEGRLNAGYHDAEPLWLLRHARAARQGLESCTSCHQQKDCMQCHSQLGAFKVSPHGPDFDARRAQRRNPVICFACHTTDPLQRGATP